jgi:hypothetical protein
MAGSVRKRILIAVFTRQYLFQSKDILLSRGSQVSIIAADETTPFSPNPVPKARMEHILQAARRPFRNLRVTLLEPSPYDVTQEPQFPGGYNSVLVRYGQ